MPALQQKRINKHVLWVSINRPEARNAIDLEVMDEMEKVNEEVQRDKDIRLFVFSGSGDKAFVSGGDLRKFHTITSESEAAEMSRRMQQILLKIEQLPCWTIACLNGDAYGGGTEMMLAFDFRLSCPGVKIGFTQGKFNLVPGWGGLTRMMEKVGRSKTLKWLANTEILSAEEALEADLIEAIIPGNKMEEEVANWGDKLIKYDREFIKTLKEGTFRFAETRKEMLRAEIEPFAKIWADEEHIKRVERFLEK